MEAPAGSAEQRLTTLEARLEESVGRQSALTDEVRTVATLLAQTAEDREKGDEKDNLELVNLGSSLVFGFVSLLLGLIGIAGYATYKALFNKLEADLVKKSDTILDEAKYKTASLIYFRLSQTYYEMYSGLDAFNTELYKLGVRMATRFAEGAYDQVMGLNKTPAGTTGKYKDFFYIASNNLAYHLATLEHIEKKKDFHTADKVRTLTADIAEFREKCWHGEYAYPWYELEETSIRVQAVFGDANDTAEAHTRFLNLLENTYVPHDWRLRIRTEYDRTGIFPIDAPAP